MTACRSGGMSARAGSAPPASTSPMKKALTDIKRKEHTRAEQTRARERRFDGFMGQVRHYLERDPDGSLRTQFVVGRGLDADQIGGLGRQEQRRNPGAQVVGAL